MFKEQHQEALVEFKGAGKLAKDLPHTVQEEQEDRSLLARLAVRVSWLGTALLKWVTCLDIWAKRWQRLRGETAKKHPKKTEVLLQRKCYSTSKLREAHLEPLTLQQALESSDGPAGRIENDLSQGGHLQGGVCPFCTVNEHWSALPETNIDVYSLYSVSPVNLK